MTSRVIPRCNSKLLPRSDLNLCERRELLIDDLAEKWHELRKIYCLDVFLHRQTTKLAPCLKRNDAASRISRPDILKPY
jgi:hypothetical protein